ncbi:RagB/SusD family nutrient uptake outer membrane protein [Flavitalea flava]
MKSIVNKLIIGTLAFTLLLTSCSKNYLKKNPQDSVPLDLALVDSNAMQAALYGAYAQLRAVGMYGRDLPVLGDLMGDNTYVEKSNSGRYLPNYAYTVTQSDGTALNMWQAAYAAILRANQIIDSKLTGNLVNQVKAQAYGIRALCYFKLVNIFAKPYTDDPHALGVPLVLHYAPDYLPKRSPVDSVYMQIVSDLKAGVPLAPDYVSSVTLSKYAIEGLLARAYLYMGDNTNAEATATDVINNSGFTLVTPGGYSDFWSNPAAQTDQVEVMFEVDADVINNNTFDGLSNIYYPGGYKDIYASQQLYNLYTSADIRQSLLVPGTTKSGAAAYVVTKFPNAANPDPDNLKVIRLAEVYLIAAEAAPDDATALGFLNDLMAQRDPSLVYASSGVQLKDDIIKERRKELAFEGDRLYDLNRLKLAITRQSNPGAILAGPGDVNLTVPYPDNRRVQPIPQSETQANANIADQQNPGYF